MWQEVRRLRDQGMTIFLTTHYLDEADALCDRISIIDAGLIVAEGTPSDLKREISGDVIIVDLAAPDTAGAPEPTVMLEASKILTEQPYVQSCETIDHTLRLYVDSAATAIPQVMRALSNKGIEPGAIESRRPSLDDVFLAKTGRTLGRLIGDGREESSSYEARPRYVADPSVRRSGNWCSSPVNVAISLIQPVTYLLLFTPFLKSVMGASSYGGAYAIYVPSLFAAMGVFSGMFAGFALIAAIRQGVIARFRVTPLSRVGLLLGRELDVRPAGRASRRSWSPWSPSCSGCG